MSSGRRASNDARRQSDNINDQHNNWTGDRGVECERMRRWRRVDKADEADTVSIVTKQQNQRGRDSDEGVCSDDTNDTDLGSPTPRALGGLRTKRRSGTVKVDV